MEGEKLNAHLTILLLETVYSHQVNSSNVERVRIYL